MFRDDSGRHWVPAGGRNRVDLFSLAAINSGWRQ
jgi:hypothetical protein